MKQVLKQAILGPFMLSNKKAKIMGLFTTIVLTLLTQVGGLIVWPFWFWAFGNQTESTKQYRKTKGVGKLFGVYMLASLFVVPLIAQKTGRTRLPLYTTETLPLGPQSILFPLLNRTYLRHHTYDALVDSVQRASKKEPDMIVRYLDGGFPFPIITLLPHLSHIDGQRIDLAFQFKKNDQYIDGARSPIGYWGYAQESKERCTNNKSTYIIPLRWDFKWLQPLLPDLKLDIKKNRTLFKSLASHKNVCGILVEPTLHKLLSAPKLKTNSCDVARHDDHFHVSIKQHCP